MSAPTGADVAAPPGRLQLALAPALITLGVTLLRLVLELAHAPAWLASREAGGRFALVGISWLPLLFGPWFALRIAKSLPGTKRRLGRLVTTLMVYGYLARIPVYALFFLDYAFKWGTHFAAVPPSAAAAANEESFTHRALGMAVAQLGFWPLVWTVIVGGIAGAIALAVARPRVESAVPA